jgi:hypothetical protein
VTAETPFEIFRVEKWSNNIFEEALQFPKRE